MKEIAANIGIEQNSLGLIGGIIKGERQVILVDSPFKKGECGNWKASSNINESEDPCYLIVLDTNYDRLLSVKGCDCVIVVQNNAIVPIRGRNPALKLSDESPQHSENPEPVINLNRLIPPEISFDKHFRMFLDDMQLDLEHHAGANHAGVWVDIPEAKVVFVGDTVVVDQPPFLAYANLELWEADLKLLTSERFNDYQIISSRSGLVDQSQIAEMMGTIAFILQLFDELAVRNASLEDWLAVIPQISEKTNQLELFNSELFYNRLHWGITTYYDLNNRERG